MSKTRQRQRVGALLAVLGISLGSQAAAQHPLSDIATVALLEMEARAHARHYEAVEVQVRPLDARLNLARCGQPLTVLAETSQRVLGPVSVGLRCEAPQPWTLYVRGHVSAAATVPVLATSIARGEIISKRDLRMQTQRIIHDQGPIVSDLGDIVGKEARRSLSPGKALRYSDLRSPELVARGDQVLLVTAESGLKVSMQGKAMAGGAAGDRILVTNLSSGKRVEGIITNNGTVLMQ